MKVEHPLIRKCVFIIFLLALRAMANATKSALDLPCTKVGVPYSDFKQYIISTWQDDWNGVVANKLHSVKLVLGDL